MESKQYISDTDSAKLIKEVKKRPCIWNPDDPNYCEKYHLAEAWEEIAKTMDLPEELIRVKWKNLRDVFKKEVRRKNLETVDDYYGKWRHFKSLGFLLREGEAQTGSEVETEQVNTREYEAKYIPQPNVEVFIDEPVAEKRRRTSEDDFDMMFLKSLTPFLKQLEPTRNLIVRSKIQSMLLNEIAAQEASHNAQSKKS